MYWNSKSFSYLPLSLFLYTVLSTERNLGGLMMNWELNLATPHILHLYSQQLVRVFIN